MIPLTFNEIRRLFARLITNTIHTIDHWLHWLAWRRRHQARAKTNDGLRAYGVAIDVGDGIDYEVAINQLRLQILAPNGAWSDIGMPGTVNTSWNNDYDGYHEDADTADGALFSCRALGQFITVRAYAHFS
jgi:hypothetical protein